MRRAVGSFRRRPVAISIATLTVVCSMLCSPTFAPAARAADGVWTQLAPPQFRFGHTAVYDRVRHRMIVFGGLNALAEMNDVWVLDLSYPNRWRRLLPTGTPPSPRRQHSAVYDVVHDRMLVYGGGWNNGTWHLNSEVWALELAGVPHWTQLTPGGTLPPPRFSASVVYDAKRDRMLVFGGGSGLGGPLGDMWALSLSGAPAWTLISANAAIGPRALAVAVVDSVRDRMVVMGGVTGNQSLSDTWTVPLGTGIGWTELTTLGTAPATLGHAGVYDPLHDQLVVFGGIDAFAHQYLLGAWRLRFDTTTPTWVRGPLSGEIPPATALPSAVYDPIADAVRLFGGWGGVPSTANQQVWTLWMHPSPNWGAALPANAPPALGREGASVAYDPAHQRMFLFGGQYAVPDAGTQSLNDVWMLDLTSAPTWTPIAPTGTPPAGRSFAAMVYDPSGDRLIVHGGESPGGVRHPDVWSLSLTGTPAWSGLAPSGTPPIGRSRHGAVYDPARDRMVVFGGSSLVAPYHQNDAWSLSLSGPPAWTALTPAGTPPSRRQALSVALDAGRDRMLVFGGLSDQPPILNNDVWALNLSGSTAWDSLEISVGPPPRHQSVVVCDSARDRLLMFGGYADLGTGQERASDLWSLPLAGAPVWTALQPDGAIDPDAGHSAIFDVAGDRMIKYGGVFGHNATWIWQPTAVLAAAPPLMRGEIRLRATPNPTRGAVELSFVLPTEVRATVSVFDVSGRRVARIVDATLPAGPHTARWDGRVAGRAGPAGVYLARLEYPGGFATTRLLLIN